MTPAYAPPVPQPLIMAGKPVARRRSVEQTCSPRTRSWSGPGTGGTRATGRRRWPGCPPTWCSGCCGRPCWPRCWPSGAPSPATTWPPRSPTCGSGRGCSPWCCCGATPSCPTGCAPATSWSTWAGRGTCRPRCWPPTSAGPGTRSGCGCCRRSRSARCSSRSAGRSGRRPGCCSRSRCCSRWSSASRIRFLLNCTAFWLLDARGAIAVWGVAGGVLTGLVMPLPWFPAWAQAALWWTPFPALMQSPIDVFTERGDPLGRARPPAGLGRGAAAASAGWCWPAGPARLVVQGG